MGSSSSLASSAVNLFSAKTSSDTKAALPNGTMMNGSHSHASSLMSNTSRASLGSMNGYAPLNSSSTHASLASFSPFLSQQPKDDSTGHASQRFSSSANMNGTDMHVAKPATLVAGEPQDAAYEHWRSTVLSMPKGPTERAGAAAMSSAGRTVVASVSPAGTNLSVEAPLIDLSTHPKSPPPAMGVFSGAAAGNSAGISNSLIDSMLGKSPAAGSNTQRADSNMNLPNSNAESTPLKDANYDQWRHTVLSLTPQDAQQTAQAAAACVSSKTAEAQESLLDLDLSHLVSQTCGLPTPSPGVTAFNASPPRATDRQGNSSFFSSPERHAQGAAQAIHTPAAANGTGTSPVRDQAYEAWRSKVLNPGSQPSASVATTPQIISPSMNGHGTYSGGSNGMFDAGYSSKSISTSTYGYETLETPRVRGGDDFKGYASGGRGSADKAASMKSPRISSLLAEGKRMCTSIVGSVGVKRGRVDSGSDKKRKSPSTKSFRDGGNDSENFNSRMQAAFQKMEKNKRGYEILD